MYKKLHDRIFENEDNFLFNSDFVDDFLNMLLEQNLNFEAIIARKKFIKYMIKSKNFDHQIRRAYLEIMCLRICCNEKFKIA